MRVNFNLVIASGKELIAKSDGDKIAGMNLRIVACDDNVADSSNGIKRARRQLVEVVIVQRNLAQFFGSSIVIKPSPTLPSDFAAAATPVWIR